MHTLCVYMWLANNTIILYYTGTTVLHSWGEVAGVEWSPDTWMVEYGRGFVPSTILFALSDVIFGGSLDYYNCYKIIRIYVIAMLSEAGIL